MTDLSTNYLRLCDQDNCARLTTSPMDPAVSSTQDSEMYATAGLELIDLWKAIPTGEAYITEQGILGLSEEEQSARFQQWIVENSDVRDLDTVVLRNWTHNTLPKELQYFVRLKKIDFHSGVLTEIPSLIFSLTHLQALIIYSPLTAVSSRLKELSHLRELSIQGGSFLMVPEEICDLPCLEKLDVSSNQLTALPSNIGYLTRLKWLDATKNHVADLPASLGNCLSLETLHLSWNQLQKIPDEIWKLPNLRSLWCGNNQLNLLPQLHEPSRLQICHLDKNHLNAIPHAFVQQLPHLKQLYFRNNPLNSVPDVSQWNVEEICY
ncbi:MAG: leucine-rich repeat domain-containing protein [Verrucomicrobia bacterium]|nr:leucine-rich repeat domain-containing protein [Verrucomicrobiota bacterium]